MTVMRLLIISQKTGEDRMEQMIEFLFTLYFSSLLFVFFLLPICVFFTHIVWIILSFANNHLHICLVVSQRVAGRLMQRCSAKARGPYQHNHIIRQCM